MILEYLNRYKEDLNDCKNYMKNIRTWYKIIPNLLTIARPIGMIPAIIMFFSGNIVPAVFLTGGLLITDFFDGKLARKWEVQSRLGADLDAVGDKIMFLGMALPILVNYPVMFINVLGEALISYINIKGIMNGLDMETVFSGKIKTWFLSITLGMGYLVQFFNVPISFLKLFSLITGFSQIFTIKEYSSEYNDKLSEKEYVVDSNDEVIIEDLNDIEQDKLLEQLKRERNEFVSYIDCNEKSYSKKRVRTIRDRKRS